MVEEPITKEQTAQETVAPAKKAKKGNKYISGFLKFLAYGGWIVLLALGLGIVIAISVMK